MFATLKKRQITSTCLRRSGFAQAGQITNKFQGSKFQSKEKRLGHLKLKFGTYLEFGICHFEFIPLFGSGYAGLGCCAICEVRKATNVQSRHEVGGTMRFQK